MELWIRSQDREILILAQHLDIYDASFDECCWSIEESGTTIASYNSKERALEVLDEIQNILMPKGIIKFNELINYEDIKRMKEKFDNNYVILDKNMELLQQIETHIYQMPKD